MVLFPSAFYYCEMSGCNYAQRLSIAAGGGFYNVKLGIAAWFCFVTEDKNLQPIAPTSRPACSKPFVCVQRSCLCDESRSLDGRSGAIFTIKPVACCVALRSKVVNDATGASVRAERIVKRLRGLDNCY